VLAAIKRRCNALQISIDRLRLYTDYGLFSFPEFQPSLPAQKKNFFFGRYHSRAIRSLRFHPTYPLFASASDDGTIQVFHTRVYHDLLTDALIVPLKILRGHAVRDGLGVLEIEWLDSLPWLLSGGWRSECVVSVA
jgi:WD40 repeat protein